MPEGPACIQHLGGLPAYVLLITRNVSTEYERMSLLSDPCRSGVGL